MSASRATVPDTTTSLPATPFEFSPEADNEARTILAATPDKLFRRLLSHQEAESTLLCARTVLGAFLGRVGEMGRASPVAPVDDADAVITTVREQRAELAGAIARLRTLGPDPRRVVLRQRAPLALIAGCWLDTQSQPATQPAAVVNQLLTHYFRLKGGGIAPRAVQQLRRRALEDAGVFLPDVEAGDFLHKADARPLTSVQAAFYLALSRLPANFLPEVVGVHYAYLSLGVDDQLIGTDAPLPESMLRDILAMYLSLAGLDEDRGSHDRQRLLAAVRLVLTLEREHVDMLTELAQWHAGLSLDARVAAIVQRHAPFAGRQHDAVRVGGRRLSEVFGDPDLDVAAFVADFRASPHVRSGPAGSRFLDAIRFGGAMFGIFDTHEANTLKAWVDAARAGELPSTVEVPPNDVGDEAARAWCAAVAASRPRDVVVTRSGSYDHRQLFHRMVNIENFANVIPVARQLVARVLAAAEVLYGHGDRGRYTDASYFDYSPTALRERVERIYWEKLINPYRPLAQLPDRETVIAGQRAMALENLIDGSWLCRVANLGRYRRPSDAILLSIYVDEMGGGELRKNHVALIKQVLASMSIHLPHIRDSAFLDQDELPDGYDSSIFQLGLSLFPDSLYNEILGYNLGIESTGPGELRLHEIQKLRHHGFDTAYEDVHLTIDNLSAGHAQQAVEAIVSFLDGVARDFGAETTQSEWRRIWRGYASFAYFMEEELVASLDPA